MAAIPIILVAVLLVLSLAAGACFLWLSCKICGVRAGRPGAPAAPGVGVGYRRALAVTAALGLGCALLGWLLAAFGSRLVPDSPLSLLLAGIALYLLLVLLLLRPLLPATFLRSILVSLQWNVFLGVYAVSLLALVYFLAVDPVVFPTGSMAETILGYHKEVTCPQCGLVFPVNASVEVEPIGGEPARVFACTCPNCRQQIHFPGAPAAWTEGNPGSVEAPDPGHRGGDRLILGKWLLGAEVFSPARLDPVAFLYHNPRRTGGPGLKYLKRLVGLPGEAIAISRGDLYVLGADQGLTYDDSKEAAAGPDDLPKPLRIMHANDERARKLFEQGKFQILRKPPDKILALRRLVYDQDHPARDLGAEGSRWRPQGEGWSEAAPGGFRHAGGDGWLSYRHLLRGHDGKPSLITDFMGYNTGLFDRKEVLPGENWAGDLILECEVTPDGARGELTLELSRGVDRFQARWALGARTCTLVRLDRAGAEVQKLDSRPSALEPGSPHRVRFANVDERLTVWVDEALPFGEGVAYPPPSRAGPVVENDLERPAGIGARGAGLTVRHIGLFRDTYYTAAVGDSRPPSAPDVPFDPADPSTWEALREPPVGTAHVPPGYYFVLGDNSPESADSRTFGPVPGQHLLGKAFFVYYPRERAGPVR